MGMEQELGLLKGALSNGEAAYLVGKGFTISSDNENGGMMYRTFENEEYVMNVIVVESLLTAFVMYADDERDGVETEVVDEFSRSFTSDSLAFVFDEMVSFARNYFSSI